MSATEQVQTPAAAVPAEEDGHKIFAGNLAYATTNEALQAFFAPHVGEIKSAQIILRGTRSTGYGFVTVTNEADTAKAVAALNGKELDGRPVLVESAKPLADKEKERTERRARKRATTGRRGNKAPTGEVTEAEANGETAPDGTAAGGAANGEAKPKRAKKPRAPKKKASEGEEAAGAAVAEGEKAAATEKKVRKPRAPKVPRAPGEQPAGEPSKSVLFVANLAFNVDDAALSQLFTAEGINVVSARVVRRRFGQPRRSKGYGFVDVGDEDNQKKALAAFNGKEIGGREIAVKIAVSAVPGEDDEVEGAKTEPEAQVVAH